MSEFNKYSTDGGATFIDVEDTNGRIMSEQLIRDTVGWTGKNKLYTPFPRFEITGSLAGITATDNKDGTITVNAGTATHSGGYWLYASNITAEELGWSVGTYTLSCEFSSNIAGVSFQIRNRTTNIDYGVNISRLSQNMVVASSADKFHIYIWIDNGVAVPNKLILKPMLRLVTISDSTFEPYHDNVSTEITDVYKVMGEMGAKNFCQRTRATQTIGEVTFTVNSDESITATASSATTAFRNFAYSAMKLKAGHYIFTGCPAGGDSSNTYAVEVYNVDNSSRIGWDTGNGIEFTLPNDTNILVNISIRSGYNLSGNSKTFYPMIRIADYPDDNYYPYGMSNVELTKRMGSLIASTEDLNDYKDTGLYYFTNAPAHSPENASYSGLIVIKEAGAKQFIIRQNVLYTRSYDAGSNTWGSWYKYSGTIVS